MIKIKIKINRKELYALHDFIINLMLDKSINYEERVTKEVMLYIIYEMEKMMNNPEQKKFTLRWYSFQALAFCEFFRDISLINVPYEDVLIRRIYTEINQHSMQF